MHCANPKCNAIADDLLKGTLRLVEFETAPDDRILYSSGGFPVCAARTKYFWLCENCSQRFRMARWNSSGLILDPLPDYDVVPLPRTARKTAIQETPNLSSTMIRSA